MNSLINLFAGEDTRCAAMALAVIAFLLGGVVTCLACRLSRRGGCCRKEGAKAKAAAADAVKFQKRHAPPADGSIEIYVGNLSYDLTEDRLRQEFEAFGTVNSARIITNRYNGKSKGFGFVHMPNRAEADAACAAMNDKEILGRKLKCNEAKNVG